MSSGKSDLLVYLRNEMEKRKKESIDEEKEDDKKLIEQFLKGLDEPKRQVFFIEGHF